MQTEQNPLILTLRLDEKSQAFFNEMRKRHFPPERNFLKAHLTLFHQLPSEVMTWEYFSSLQYRIFAMKVTGLCYLGAGVAYDIDSGELQELHRKLSQYFHKVLIPQDRQPFKPHITIQNKVTPAASKDLLIELMGNFKPFTVTATGLDLWEYLGGPWRHSSSYDFLNEH
ncbi:2'-5' RNA ligase superfamily protein [Mucilaginibacter gossypiicola]|uniref:2'-5' RNA ligase superfamily protein n=1 Tax=Mucilaginibacter gossypiicola TaxID=551995 RepID=A0A1H8KTM6_9SPHI|nr:2'-5' RNA ligase family protein [Mucilaginibacter gossypiicola]SEN96270.1 2'-5' RNA ligase superfamily protein [Mucilaginibacter gossypiicola]